MKTLIALLLMTTAVAAQDVMVAPKPNDETVKTMMLLRAFEANENSMTRWGSFDATATSVHEKTMYAPKVVVPASELNALDVVVDTTEPPPVKKIKTLDTCKRHNMRKVTSADGTSWKCRR